MIRALVTFEPSALPSMTTMRESPIDEQRECGILPGEDGEWLSAHFDPAGVDGTIESNEPWIRETSEGVEMARHPEAALRDDPALWGVMAMWSTGLFRKALTPDDFDRLSNFEIDLILTAQGAHDREVDRRAKQRAGAQTAEA